MFWVTHMEISKTEYHYSSLWRLTERFLWSCNHIISPNNILSTIGIVIEARLVLALVWWDSERCTNQNYLLIYTFYQWKKYRNRISVKYELKRQIKNAHFNVEEHYLCIDSGKHLVKEKKCFFLARFGRTNGRCWLAGEHILRQALSPLCYAYNCTCLLQLLLLFFSSFWLYSNYLQCRPARAVQGKQEHFIILVYSVDLCFYFTWQEDAEKIKQAALGFDLSFFHFKCPETLTLFRLWYSDFQHFYFKCHCLSLW